MTTKSETTPTRTTRTAENENVFTRDLALAQAEMENAAYNKVNPHFKSRYADFEAVRKVSVPILARHGFAVTTTFRVEYTPHGDLLRIMTTLLTHEYDDESRTSEWIIVGDTEQQRGSSITYGRRYSLSALVCIASEDDDDANEAMGAGVKVKSAYQARDDKDYEILLSEMKECETRNDLFEWRKSVMSRRAALPTHWRDLLDEESERHRLELIDSEKANT